jgi:hypothetical protein
MKKALSLIACSLLLQASVAFTQPSASNDPEIAVTGQVVLPDNSTVSGSVKDNIRKKGELTILTNGKKTKYKAGDISTAQVGSSNYITWNYTFYEILWQGRNLTLLRKANEPSGVQYSGSNPVVVTSEGSVDDLFIRQTGNSSLQWLTKKNIKEALGKICSSCSIDAAKFDAETVKKAVEDCDKCK